MRTVGFRLPFAGQQSLLEQLRVERIEAFAATFILVHFLVDVTAVWHADPAFEVWNGATWIKDFYVTAQPTSKSIAYTSASTINVGNPWRILTRPVSLQIPPKEWPLPQTGICVSP